MKRFSIAIILVCLMAFLALGAAYNIGYDRCETKHTKEATDRAGAVSKAVDTRLQENTETARFQADINTTIKGSYADETATIAGVYAGSSITPGRVRVRAPDCPGPARAAPPPSTSRGDAAPAPSGVLPESLAVRPDGGAGIEMSELADAQTKARAEEADLVVASCRVAQEFIKLNGLSP